ncbi:ammonium transporter [Flammeovirgaceae bacterium SG7u.111]|nr:ammonium transporter [Flammeovirgaceae bacterium SG7u.132]WPO36338.1 ammonium transporter [Flammeovirgaceae bacterium SG7u.111]
MKTVFPLTLKIFSLLLLIVFLYIPAMAGSEPTPHEASITLNLDRLWILISAALVFFMQAGFKCLEVGMVRTQHSTVVSMKNLVDWVVVSVAFFLIGFGLMFGHSAGGFIGTDLFMADGVEGAEGGSPLGITFFLFQLAFAGTALTIVSGAMSERTGFVPYLTASLVMGLVIYPVFGHWAWGNLFFGNNPAWLADLGFMDFAGSTVVHSVGAWVALVGIWIVGPRLGRYSKDGKVRDFRPHSFAYSALGVIILWLGWWGFNGGSTLALDSSVEKIILNTNLAAAAAGISAFFHSYFFQKKADLYGKLMGGILTGLVAITAGANVVSFGNALLIGILAGLIHNYTFDLLIKKWKLDDPVGAIPVHGFGGVFGTLAVAIFGKEELLALPRFQQLGVQFLGVAVCFIFTSAIAFVMFKALKATVGLRVSPIEEKEGIDYGKKYVDEIEEEALSEQELLHLMAGLNEDEVSEMPQKGSEEN